MGIVIFVDFAFLMHVYVPTTQFSNGILLCQGSFIQCKQCQKDNQSLTCQPALASFPSHGKKIKVEVKAKSQPAGPF